jgi:hypothetical protein
MDAYHLAHSLLGSPPPHSHSTALWDYVISGLPSPSKSTQSAEEVIEYLSAIHVLPLQYLPKILPQKRTLGCWGCSLVAEHLPSMYICTRPWFHPQHNNNNKRLHEAMIAER